MADPEQLCEAMLNQKLLGIKIENEEVILTFEHGVIEFSGESLEMYVEANKPN